MSIHSHSAARNETPLVPRILVSIIGDDLVRVRQRDGVIDYHRLCIRHQWASRADVSAGMAMTAACPQCEAETSSVPGAVRYGDLLRQAEWLR